MRLNAKQSVGFTCATAQVNVNLLCRVLYGHRPKICRYYLKYPYGYTLLKKLSEDELLFIMPNNVKKRLGLPMTKVAKRGRRVRDYRRKHIRALVFPHMYAWIDAWVEDQVRKDLNKVIDNMVSVGDFAKEDCERRGVVVQQYFPTASAQHTMIRTDDNRLYHAPTTMFVKVQSTIRRYLHDYQ